MGTSASSYRPDSAEAAGLTDRRGEANDPMGSALARICKQAKMLPSGLYSEALRMHPSIQEDKLLLKVV